jgi:hypothetical protein
LGRSSTVGSMKRREEEEGKGAGRTVVRTEDWGLRTED